MGRQLTLTEMQSHQFSLEVVLKAKVAWEQFNAIDTESPEWKQASREWEDRSMALAHAMLNELEGRGKANSKHARANLTTLQLL